MAPVMAEWMSESVAAMTRAAKVDGVQLVIGVQDERDVQGAGRGLGGLFAVEHPEKVAGMGERGSASTSGLPLRMRSKMATSMAIWEVRRKLLRTLASCELSASSGS